MNKQYAWEKEWNRLLTQEQAFLKSHAQKRESVLNRKIEAVMPENMQEILDKAFCSAFSLIFQKGTGVIEKTYSRTKLEEKRKVAEYALSLRENRENISRFRKNAGKSKGVNLAVSAVEGSVLGLFGVGVPDIPIFVALMLRSVYETATQYGFDYKSKEEQIFILKLIENSLSYGKETRSRDYRLNCAIEENRLVWKEDLDTQIQRTASLLSEQLLYQKFLQTLPVVGVVGGAVDVWCLQQVTTYTELKYRRRFLQKKHPMKRK